MSPPARRLPLATRSLTFGVLAWVSLVPWIDSAPLVLDPARPIATCALLPTASVSYLAALHPNCPLDAYERVDAVEFAGAIHAVDDRQDLLESIPAGPVRLYLGSATSQRQSELTLLRAASPASRTQLWLGLAVGAVAFAGAVRLVMHRTSPASLPLVTLLAALIAYAGCTLGSTGSARLDFSWVALPGILAASSTHLALVFPRERRIVERLPGLIGLPYALAGVLVALGWLLLLRGSELWELLDRMLCTWFVAAGTVLAASTAVALAEAGSPRERRLAGALVYVSAALIGLGLALSLGLGSSLPLGPRRTVAVTSALMLGAFGYALALHGRLDTPRFVRWLTSQAVYSGLVASATWALGWVGRSRWGWPAIDVDPPIFLSAVFASLLALDALRRIAWRLSGDWVTPWAPRLERARTEFFRGRTGRGEPDQWMDLLVGAISGALAARRATGFLRLESGGLRLAAVRGAKFDTELARSTEALLADLGRDVTGAGPIVLREIAGQKRLDVAALRRAGVSLVCPLPGSDRLRGLLLIGGIRSEHDLSSDQLSLVEQFARHAALEIDKADLEQELLVQARIAGIGYAAAGLAHDLGRPLGEILLETRQSRWPNRQLIGQLAGECIEVLERVLEEGKTGQRLPGGVAPLALVLEAAAGRIGARHGGRQPVLRLSPQLPQVGDSRDLQRVVEELLENAMRWSSGEQAVELIATAEGAVVTVRVVDHGTGMNEADLRRAFEPFFSTRSSTGLGLVVCHDIVRRLGGSLHLESSPGAGTTAVLQMPRAR